LKLYEKKNYQMVLDAFKKNVVEVFLHKQQVFSNDHYCDAFKKKKI